MFLGAQHPHLVTLDVARRVASLLSNALAFANTFTSQHKEELAEQPTPANAPSTSPPGLSLATREALLRRRVYAFTNASVRLASRVRRKPCSRGCTRVS